MDFGNFKDNVVRWATDRKIIQNSNVQTQALKMVSEMGELCDAIIKDEPEKILDGAGDVLVCLINLMEIRKLSLEDAMQHAWNEIKDRKGYLNSNGVYIKEA